ncbi:inositol-trisphosphate 3-kinase A [Brachionus plicatilis]|uniref:Kinase n=1 Tax=Brachionus plicatilis TaxID=10195 RepID=A0A3M7QBB0_BRAPC|nr:inositol-trisphosphate 3-kinase A [Brachionus plicatilis]
MKTLLNFQRNSNLDSQASGLVLGESAKLESVFFARNRSLSKSEAGLNSIPSKNLSKSESFSFEDSSLKIGENDHSLNKVSQWDLLCQVINCKVAFKKQFNGIKYNWIQLAGHAGRFKPGDREGYILKIMDDSEKNCLALLQNDILSEFVPKIDRTSLNFDNNYYTEMQDLLYGFSNPCIMDIKIGVRTFIIDESNDKETKPRNDLYIKLINIDPDELTEEEHQTQAINKRRYMSWRERCTCSATLGFRIEAVKKSQVQEKEFYSMKKKSQVFDHIKNYTDNNKSIMEMYLNRLCCLQRNLKQSDFFNSHEMIGSSLLFVHDQSRANIWMIDFGKTRKLPDGVRLKHDVRWEEGTLEDGYLIGIQSLIDIFREAIEEIY